MGLVVPTASLGPVELSGDVSKYYVIVGTAFALGIAALVISDSLF